jgi:cell division septum initiation protein DivIVA
VRGETGISEETSSSPDSPLAGEGVGARVTAVFTAAEKAAEHIMSLAREEADDIRRRTHAEIDTYRQECRNTAEEEAQRIIQAAHDRAGQIERDARAAGEELERAARERRNRLLEETHLIEERVEWAREGLREVVGRLEQVASPDATEPVGAGLAPPDKEPAEA